MMSLFRSVQLFLAASLLLAVGFFVGRYQFPASAVYEAGSRDIPLASFWQAWEQLHTSFIGDLDDQKLLYGAVEGMVRAAGDPYTVFADPEESKQFEDVLTGSFSGVGVEIGLRKGLVTVIAPLDGSPAEKAGLKAGDSIIAIDQEPLTQDSTLDEVVRKIRGEKGTEVTLTVIRQDNGNEPKEITIRRDTIEIESVKYTLEGNIAHIRITNFSEDTPRRFAQAVKAVQDNNIQGIILDLRGNPGGFLQGAVQISSYFLERDQVVVSEKGKKEKEYTTVGRHDLQTIPVVILVDEGSASASEIVAGALRDNRDIQIIGKKTFGKGSVQELTDFDDGSHIRVTVAKWYTPKGTSIDQEGIHPSIEIDDNADTEEDEQLNRAREELKAIIK